MAQSVNPNYLGPNGVWNPSSNTSPVWGHHHPGWKVNNARAEFEEAKRKWWLRKGRHTKKWMSEWWPGAAETITNAYTDWGNLKVGPYGGGATGPGFAYLNAIKSRKAEQAREEAEIRNYELELEYNFTKTNSTKKKKKIKEKDAVKRRLGSERVTGPAEYLTNRTPLCRGGIRDKRRRRRYRSRYRRR